MKTALSPDVERLIMEKVKSGRYHSADEVVRKSLILLQKDEEKTVSGQSDAALDLTAKLESIASDVPEAEWQKVPSDLSQNIDHYLYGSRKIS